MHVMSPMATVIKCGTTDTKYALFSQNQKRFPDLVETRVGEVKNSKDCLACANLEEPSRHDSTMVKVQFPLDLTRPEHRSAAALATSHRIGDFLDAQRLLQKTAIELAEPAFKTKEG